MAQRITNNMLSLKKSVNGSYYIALLLLLCASILLILPDERLVWIFGKKLELGLMDPVILLLSFFLIVAVSITWIVFLSKKVEKENIEIGNTSDDYQFSYFNYSKSKRLLFYFSVTCTLFSGVFLTLDDILPDNNFMIKKQLMEESSLVKKYNSVYGKEYSLKNYPKKSDSGVNMQIVDQTNTDSIKQVGYTVAYSKDFPTEFYKSAGDRNIPIPRNKKINLDLIDSYEIRAEEADKLYLQIPIRVSKPSNSQVKICQNIFITVESRPDLAGLTNGISQRSFICSENGSWNDVTLVVSLKNFKDTDIKLISLSFSDPSEDNYAHKELFNSTLNIAYPKIYYTKSEQDQNSREHVKFCLSGFMDSNKSNIFHYNSTTNTVEKGSCY